MEELSELRSYIEQGKYPEALVLLGEMEEMSHEDKINKIGSFLVILLLHLVKKHAEKRTTRSWETSIQNALDEIAFTNKRRKAGGYHLGQEELQEAITERYGLALRSAALEAFGGLYEARKLAELVDAEQIKAEALQLILDVQ